MQIHKVNNKIYFNYFDKANAIISIDEDNRHISLELIKVNPHFRKIGIASMMINEILKYIRFFYKEIKKVILNPLPLEASGIKLVHLINFYKKFGFVRTHTTDRSTPYLMTKIL